VTSELSGGRQKPIEACCDRREFIDDPLTLGGQQWCKVDTTPGMLVWDTDVFQVQHDIPQNRSFVLNLAVRPLMRGGPTPASSPASCWRSLASRW
jgi:hypothetical protein